MALIKEQLLLTIHEAIFGKSHMVLNNATLEIGVHPETYEVRVNGELLTCEPAEVVPMAQRYFLF